MLTKPTERALEEHIGWAFREATRALLEARGVSAAIERPALHDLRADLTPRAPIPATEPAPAVLARLTLFRDRRPLATLRIYVDRSVCAAGSTLRHLVEAEDRLLAWLEARGVDTLKARACSVSRARCRREWLEAAPPPLRGDLTVGPACQAQAAPIEHHLPAAASGAIDARLLLAWHGAGEGPWSEMPPCTAASGALLGVVPLQRVIALLASGAPSKAMIRGAARLFAAEVRSWADADELRDKLPPAIFDALLDEARRSADPETIARLELCRSGRPAPAPPGAELLCSTRAASLRRLHSQGPHACALEGRTLHWIGPSGVTRRDLPLVRATEPVAVREGAVFWNGARRLDVHTGEVTEAPRPSALARLIPRESRALAAFRGEIVALCLARFGEAPLLEADGEAEAAAWLLAMPTRNDEAAWEAYAHLGVTAPLALGSAHLWVYRRGEGTLHGLPRSRRARACAFPFEGPLVALAASRGGVHALERSSGEACRWWEVTEAGGKRLCGEVALPPRAVREVRDIPSGLLIHTRELLEDRLMLLPRG